MVCNFFITLYFYQVNEGCLQATVATHIHEVTEEIHGQMKGILNLHDYMVLA